MANCYVKFATRLKFSEDESKRLAEREFCYKHLLHHKEDRDFWCFPKDTQVSLGFDYSIHDDSVDLYEDENADVMQVAHFIYNFYKHFDIDGMHSFTFIETGDRITPDAFWGGVIIVTKSRIDYIEPSSIIERWGIEHGY